MACSYRLIRCVLSAVPIFASTPRRRNQNPPARGQPARDAHLSRARPTPFDRADRPNRTSHARHTRVSLNPTRASARHRTIYRRVRLDRVKRSIATIIDESILCSRDAMRCAVARDRGVEDVLARGYARGVATADAAAATSRDDEWRSRGRDNERWSVLLEDAMKCTKSLLLTALVRST